MNSWEGPSPADYDISPPNWRLTAFEVTMLVLAVLIIWLLASWGVTAP